MSDDRRYCTICGKRIVPHTNTQTYQDGRITGIFSLYLSDSTEPICFGHDNTPPPVKVPQAFYDAFSDDEVQP